MRKNQRSWISLLMVFVLVLGMIPTYVVSANTDDTTPDGSVGNPYEYTYGDQLDFISELADSNSEQAYYMEVDNEYVLMSDYDRYSTYEAGNYKVTLTSDNITSDYYFVINPIVLKIDEESLASIEVYDTYYDGTTRMDCNVFIQFIRVDIETDDDEPVYWSPDGYGFEVVTDDEATGDALALTLRVDIQGSYVFENGTQEIEVKLDQTASRLVPDASVYEMFETGAAGTTVTFFYTDIEWLGTAQGEELVVTGAETNAPEFKTWTEEYSDETYTGFELTVEIPSDAETGDVIVVEIPFDKTEYTNTTIQCIITVENRTTLSILSEDYVSFDLDKYDDVIDEVNIKDYVYGAYDNYYYYDDGTISGDVVEGDYTFSIGEEPEVTIGEDGTLETWGTYLVYITFTPDDVVTYAPATVSIFVDCQIVYLDVSIANMMVFEGEENPTFSVDSYVCYDDLTEGEMEYIVNYMANIDLDITLSSEPDEYEWDYSSALTTGVYSLYSKNYLTTGGFTVADGTGLAINMIPGILVVVKASSSGNYVSVVFPDPNVDSEALGYTVSLDLATVNETLTKTLEDGVLSALYECIVAPTGDTDNKDIEVNISGDALDSLTGDTVNGFKLSNTELDLEFNKEALVTINKSIVDEDNVSISITDVSGYNDSLTEAQQEAIGGNEAYDFSVYADGSYVSSFGTDGQVKVSIPYDGEDGESVTVMRVSEDGTTTDMDANIEDGYAVFYTNQFSVYMVDGTSGSDESDELIFDKDMMSMIMASWESGELIIWYDVSSYTFSKEGLAYAINSGIEILTLVMVDETRITLTSDELNFIYDRMDDVVAISCDTIDELLADDEGEDAGDQSTPDNTITDEVAQALVDSLETEEKLVVQAEEVTATFTQEAIEILANSDAEQVFIEYEDITLAIDAATLQSIQEQTGGQVTIEAKEIDAATLSEANQKIVGDRPVFEFTITDADGSRVTEFDGYITISVPYTLADGESADNLVIYYLSGDTVETIQIDSYDAVNGLITFTTSHFSTYAVGYEETSSDQNPVVTVPTTTTTTTTTTATTTTSTETTTAPDTGDASNVLLYVVFAMVAGSGVVILARRKRTNR